MAITERLQVIIEAIGGPAGATFTQLGKDAQKSYADINKGSAQAEAGVTRFGSVAKAAALVAGTAIATGVIAYVKSAASEFIELANQTRRFAQLTGASAEEASIFGGVMKDLGVDQDTAAKGLGIFADHLARTPGLFSQLGVQVVKTRTGQNDLLGTLDNVRKMFNATADATVRDSIAKQLLGRGYQTLLPYLNLSNEQLATFRQLSSDRGEILTQRDLDMAREFQIQTRKLTDDFEDFKIKVGRFGVEFASNFERGLSVLSKIRTPSEAFDVLIKGDVPAAISREVQAQENLGRSRAEAELQAQQAARANQDLAKSEDGLVSSAKNLRSAQEASVQAHRAVEQAVRGVATAQQSLQKAHEGVQRAQESAAAAQQRLDDLLAKGAVDANAVADAERNLEQAARGVQRAQESLIDAQERLNEARRGATGDELTDAQLALERATLGVAQAQKSVAESRKAKAGRDPLDEASAQLSLREAIQSQTESRERLEALKQKGTSQDKEVVSAERAVRDAAQAVTDAIQGQNDAAAQLRAAQAGDPDFERNVAQAKREVRDAASALRDAQLGERDAAQGVRDAQYGVIDAKQRDQDASYNLRDAQYALNDQWAQAIGLGVDLSTVIDNLSARYPELAGIVGSLAQANNYGLSLTQLQAASNLGVSPQAAASYLHAIGAPGFAEGGWVDAPTGQPVPAIVHGGEYVVSRQMMRRGGGGASVVVNVGGSVVSERELTEIVYRALTKAGGRYSALRN